MIRMYFLHLYANSFLFDLFTSFVLGIFFVIPCTDEYRKVDLRTVSFDVPPQEVGEKCSILKKKQTTNVVDWCYPVTSEGWVTVQMHHRTPVMRRRTLEG